MPSAGSTAPPRSRSLRLQSASLRAAACCIGLSLGVAAGCAGRAPTAPAAKTDLPPPAPGTCSWFGDARGEVLYFGESAFWHAMREAGGDPQGDLDSLGPQRVGRFDLRREAMLPPLATAQAAAHSGTWDVLSHPNGRVYFTSFYDPSGWVEPRTGAARSFEAAGTGLNEIALLPDGRLLVTRYGAPRGGDGSLVVLDAEGGVEKEIPLVPEPGAVVAAKSVAYDVVRDVAWINTDVIPQEGGANRHDARVIELSTGREISRFVSPELHFPRFDHAGRGYFAWLDGSRLSLRITDPGAALAPDAGREIVLDVAFPRGIDFVQEVREQPDGRVVATRWSGRVHVVSPDGTARDVTLLRKRDSGFYYTAVATGDRVCATYCGGISVRCASLP
jgi:hypothetical protein